MARKILDILPPKKLEAEKKEIFLPENRRQPLSKRSAFYSKKPLLLILISILLLVGVFCYFALPKAEVEIGPETELKTSEVEVVIDKTVKAPDFLNKIIPGKVIEAEKTVLLEFLSSGKTLEETKAEGIIQVYNAYSTSPQTFRVQTRFISADGKLFRSTERITVPGGRYEGENLVPGFLDVKVMADQSGEEFNIGPSTFSIPGLVGTPLYTYFYGKSFQPMSGGSKKEVAQITQEDFEKAIGEVIKKAKEELRILLNEKTPLNFILLEDAIKTDILETTSSSQSKEKIEKFTVQAKVKSTALVFKLKDLEDFALQLILLKVPENKTLYQESLKKSYSPRVVDLESGKMTLFCEVAAKIYPRIDENNLKLALKGKSLVEAQLFLENHPYIIKATVRLWPFWVKKIPQKEEKIELRLLVD
ncbi:hypothetical protein AMJ50_02195 [Parcubacteria bacterium DG_74_3]|nr:MAG: hypothetical protein AMJ50_02195 [Parcubacteria bacterium DG_74_3]